MSALFTHFTAEKPSFYAQLPPPREELLLQLTCITLQVQLIMEVL